MTFELNRPRNLEEDVPSNPPQLEIDPPERP